MIACLADTAQYSATYLCQDYAVSSDMLDCIKKGQREVGLQNKVREIFTI